ncbi:MAG: PPC domain-containing protein, partial [Planctomycetota bacterium]
MRSGQKASATVHGKQLAGAICLWTPVGTLKPKEGTDLTKDQPVLFEGDIKADAAPGIYPVRMVTNHGCSEASWVVLDDLPSVAITAEADDRKSGQTVVPPCSIGGQVNPVVSKFFRIAMKAGQPLSIDVFARRLGSDLDPVVRVYGPDGAEVAFKDDIPGAEGDAQLQFTAVADGEYRIEVRDVRYSGSGRHFFHLRLGKFPLSTAISPRVVQAGQKVDLLGATGEVLAELMTPADKSPGLVPVTFRTAESDAGVIGSIA